MKLRFLDAILVAILLLTIVSGFAHTWEKTSTLKGYDSITMSADGRIICAVPSGGNLLVSTDSGKNWAPTTNNYVFLGFGPNPIAVSADGSKIFAHKNSDSIFVSTNYGGSWTSTAFPAAPSIYRIACSASGAEIVAAPRDSGPIYVSTNIGATYYTSSVPFTNWTSVAVSADGSHMIAAASSGDLYLSSNLGVDWTTAGFSSVPWSYVCISSDGEWIGAATLTNSYISCDAGASWRTNGIGGGNISCSANGTNWVLANVQLYTSSDGGLTWQTNVSDGISFSGYSYSAAVSADWSEIAVIGVDGFWIGHTTPSPQLNVQGQGTNLVLSWLVSSTNFALQQNSGLATGNWTTLSNIPTLNLTNLHQELTLLAATNSSFFRLMAQ